MQRYNSRTGKWEATHPPTPPGGSGGSGGSGGKIIAIIIVLLLVIGFLYVVGMNSENNQQQRSNQEENGGEQSNQEQGGDDQEKQGGDDQEKEGGGQANSETSTESASDGVSDLSGSTSKGDYYMDRQMAHVYGIIINTGNKAAKNVILEMTFERDNLEIGNAELRFGDIAAGERRPYDENIPVNLPRYPDNIKLDLTED